MIRPRTLLTALLAASALAASADAAPTDDLLQKENDNGLWDNGLVWGLGLGTVGLAAVAGALYYLGVGGLRHIDKENVLEHPMRQSLLDVVEDEPGVHLRELAARHGTAVTNTQWHLRKLEMAGLIRTQKVQGRRLYYPTAGGVEMKEVAMQNAATQNPNAQRIWDYLEHRSGCNQRTLAESLGMNPGTVRWHLRKMESAGLVRSMQDGTMTRYFLLKRPSRPARPSRLGERSTERGTERAPTAEPAAEPVAVENRSN